MKKVLIALLPALALIGCGDAITIETEGSYSISWGILGLLAGLAIAGLLTALAWRLISFIGSRQMILKVLKKGDVNLEAGANANANANAKTGAEVNGKENPYANGNGKEANTESGQECDKEYCHKVKKQSLWERVKKDFVPLITIGLLGALIIYLIASGFGS